METARWHNRRRITKTHVTLPSGTPACHSHVAGTPERTATFASWETVECKRCKRLRPHQSVGGLFVWWGKL